MQTMPITMLSGLGCQGCQRNCGCEQKQPFMSLNGPGIITAESVPDLSTWSCNDYVTWHKRLTEKVGLQTANEITQQFWDSIPWYRVDWNPGCSLSNCSFYNHFRSAGGGWSSLLPQAICTVDSAGGKVVEAAGKVVESVADVAENAADTAKNTTNVAKYAIPVLVGGIALGAAYYVYKNYLKGNRKVRVGPVVAGVPKTRQKRKKK